MAIARNKIKVKKFSSSLLTGHYPPPANCQTEGPLNPAHVNPETRQLVQFWPTSDQAEQTRETKQRAEIRYTEPKLLRFHPIPIILSALAFSLPFLSLFGSRSTLTCLPSRKTRGNPLSRHGSLRPPLKISSLLLISTSSDPITSKLSKLQIKVQLSYSSSPFFFSAVS